MAYELKHRTHRTVSKGNALFDTSLPSGDDFLDAGQEIEIDPSDHYLVNPRTTVGLLAQVPTAVKPAPVIQRPAVGVPA